MQEEGRWGSMGIRWLGGVGETQMRNAEGGAVRVCFASLSERGSRQG